MSAPSTPLTERALLPPFDFQPMPRVVFGAGTLSPIGVPSTAGTGSEAQSYALIADEKSHLKMACGDRKAAFRAAILDPEVTVSQPARVAAVTGIDAMSHAIESYVCTRRSPLSQAFA